MKMAAAEALWTVRLRAVLDLRLRRRQQGPQLRRAVDPGYCRSRDDDFSSYVPGINDTNKAEQAK